MQRTEPRQLTEASVDVDGDVVLLAELADRNDVVDAAVGELRGRSNKHASGPVTFLQVTSRN